jgi:hypothetical protein
MGTNMPRLKDKIAIVTGSSSGIGKAIALRFEPDPICRLRSILASKMALI